MEDIESGLAQLQWLTRALQEVDQFVHLQKRYERIQQSAEIIEELFADESIADGYPRLSIWPYTHVGPERAEVHIWCDPLRQAVRYIDVLLARLNALSGAVDLEGTGGPGAMVTVYEPHQRIEEVSGRLLRGGHFKSAVLEAYICVIDEVKEKVGAGKS